MQCVILFEFFYVSQARNLFLEGVELEQTGKLYDAILQYKKAFHLVPDIEFKVFNLSKEKDANANSNPDLINDKGTSSFIIIWTLSH